ncbi:O-antigen ligase family protein [Acutalibacter intestini]|uniref:O-antigen ligase family protein n=1 Tax=Acutalibacter intestini TaxID=3093659 RepID=UPI002AC91BAA|nr:O-antigen ligase family protein [Acutalibacter sp. M00204]
MAALLLIQPLLDVLSYFMRETGTTAVTTTLRTVLLMAVSLYGLAVSGKRRVYWVFYGVIGGFWLLHMLNCLRLGYRDPVGDAAEYLKLVQFPLWTLAFITFFKGHDRLDLRVVGILAANFGVILLIIGLSYAAGRPEYTYDIPALGVKMGLLGWFGVPNTQSAIVSMLTPCLLLWAYRTGRVWVFSLGCAAGFGLLYFTGTRLAYYSAILVAAGFLALVLIAGGRMRWCCVPLAVVLALLVLCRSMSIMERRQALTGESYDLYQEQSDHIMGEDKDFVYTSGEVPAKIIEKITRVYEEVYTQRSLADTPLLGDLLERFGTERVMKQYQYSTKASDLYNTRSKKLAVMSLSWQEQDFLGKLLGMEYATATLNGTHYDPENDFPALLYYYGYVGVGLYGAFAVCFLLGAAWGALRNWRRLRSYLSPQLLAYGMTYLLGLGAAQFSGQALRKPSLTVYLALAAAQLYTGAHSGEGKLFARYERRPGVTMKKL